MPHAPLHLPPPRCRTAASRAPSIYTTFTYRGAAPHARTPAPSSSYILLHVRRSRKIASTCAPALTISIWTAGASRKPGSRRLSRAVLYLSEGGSGGSATWRGSLAWKNSCSSTARGGGRRRTAPFFGRAASSPACPPAPQHEQHKRRRGRRRGASAAAARYGVELARMAARDSAFWNGDAGDGGKNGMGSRAGVRRQAGRRRHRAAARGTAGRCRAALLPPAAAPRAHKRAGHECSAVI